MMGCCADGVPSDLSTDLADELDVIAEAAAKVPAEAWAMLPDDLHEQIDSGCTAAQSADDAYAEAAAISRLGSRLGDVLRIAGVALEEWRKLADTHGRLPSWNRIHHALQTAAPREGRLLVYIAGPYQGETREEQEANIAQARAAMVGVYRCGHSPFCPHTMTAWLDRDAPDIARETFLATDMDWLRRCHALLVLPGWQDSAGSVAEVAEAARLGLPVYSRVEDLPQNRGAK